MRWLCLASALILSACAPSRNVPDDLRFVAFHSGGGPYPSSNRGELVDVEMETDFNYANYAGSRGVHIEFFFCENKNIDAPGLGGHSLFIYNDKWLRVDNGIHDDRPPPYRFHTATFAEIHDKTALKEPKIKIFDYDLRETPRDLCFYLGVGPYYHEKSNIVRIPKEELVKFFADHPRPQTSGN